MLSVYQVQIWPWPLENGHVPHGKIWIHSFLLNWISVAQYMSGSPEFE